MVMMKKTVLVAVFCTAVFSPAKADLIGVTYWSYSYWYCPVSYSEAKVYFQTGWHNNKEKTSGVIDVYIAGEGPFPDSDEHNTIKFPFSYRFGGPYSWNIPWRKGGTQSEIRFQMQPISHDNLSTVKIIIDEGITHIGNWLFQGLGRLEEVAPPLSLQSIGEGAFKDCGLLPLFECSDKVKSIGNRAFESCGELHEFNRYDITGSYKISNAAINIGSRAFANCKNLKYFNFTENSTIGNEAFSGSGLESIDIKPSISYGKFVFDNCLNIKSITIPGNTILGEGMFKSCTNLKSVTFEGRVSEIPARIFSNCDNLRSISIPNGATAIGKNAFDASGIISINIPNSITSIGEYAFYKTKITSVIIPNSVTKIEQNAFQSTNLTSIIVPGSVKVIEGGTFAFCNALTAVKLCEGVKSISSSAFRGCPNLQTISFPASLDSIGENAFTDFSNLKVIECNSVIPPAMHSTPFAKSDLTKASVYVPYGSVEAYKNAPIWKNFKHIGTYPTGMQLTKHSITAKSNTTSNINAYLMPHDAIPSVVWNTKNINVAEVNNGVIKFKAPGTACIVATTHNEVFKDSCFIKVLEPQVNNKYSPSLADSLYGEWTECDENRNIVKDANKLGFYKKVNTTPEGYETITYEGFYSFKDEGFPLGTLTFEEKKPIYYMSAPGWEIGGIILEITENYFKEIDFYSSVGNTITYIRTK
jgi:hypothetical protein